jgi:hypothetical protein
MTDTGNRVYFNDEAAGIGPTTSDPPQSYYVGPLVQWVKPAGGSALAAWQTQANNEASAVPAYTQIQLTGNAQEATWEFTYQTKTNGTTIRELDYGFTLDGGAYGFAILYKAPNAEWSSLQPTFEKMRNSFLPPST